MMLVRAAVADRAFAGRRVYAVAGPVHMRSAKAVDSSLREIAALGPQNRLGLHPTTDRHWVFDPNSPDAWSVTSEAGDFSELDVGTELAQMLREEPIAPVTMRLKGNYGLISFDHGLGDAHFMNELGAVCTGTDDDSPVDWRRVTEPTHPTAAAWATATREHPVGLVAGFARSVQRQFLSTQEQQREKPTADDVKRLAIVPSFIFVTSDPEYAPGLKQAMKHAPATIMSSVIVAATRSLRAFGINPSPSAGVLVDLRRYLPKDGFTLANFVSVVGVSTAPAVRPFHLDQRLRTELMSYRPLLIHSVREVTRLLPNQGPWDVPSARRARLVFSVGTPGGSSKKYLWNAAAGQPLLTATLPLQHRDQISILISRVPGGSVQMGASFFAETYDPATVREALADVLADPGATAAVLNCR